MKTSKYVQSVICIMSIFLAGCSGLSKMIKDASKIKYTVNPSPLQDNNDSVEINVTASYPAQYFNKKAVVTVTPTLKFTDGTTQALKPVTLVGEKASQSGQRINYSQGGSLSYHDKVAYNSKMKVDELDVDAVLVNNKKAIPSVKIADGTITTATLVQNNARPILGKDNFTKTTFEHDTSHIFFLISNAAVRGGEMKSKEMEKFKDFVLKGITEGCKFNGIDMSAFASPDGETARNAHLADDRAKNSVTAMKRFFKMTNTKKHNTKFGEEKDFYTIGKTGMDWDGFEMMVKASKLKDKDLILRVLSMYTDHDQRMKEIKNLAATYVELAKDVLPKLRRSVIVLNAEKKSRTDEQIKLLSAAHPDSLSVEELLYSATLTAGTNEKLMIYKEAEKQYSGDWRCFNNAAYEEIEANKMDEAGNDLTKANELAPGNPIIENNMGVVALKAGNTKGAADYFMKASAAGPDVAYNSGIIDIVKGKYADAESKMTGINSFNTALAMLLNNNISGAQAAINASADKDGSAYYLLAIIAARNSNKADVISNLKNAISQDNSFKKMAATDCEFIKYKEDKDFTSIVN